MNITISNSKNPSTPMARPASEVNDEPPVNFHRHCQKTVCSAYGYGGSGATWNILAGSDNPESNMGLPNIQEALSESETVISYFNNNENNNITYDLRAILELIEKVAATTTSPTYTLTFNDNNGQKIVGDTLSPNNRNVVFGGFGRDITLTVDGQPLNFNTMKSSGSEVTSITLPKHTLTIEYGDEPKQSFSANGIVMNQDQTLTFPSKTLTITKGEGEDEEEIGTVTGIVMDKDCKVNIPIPEAKIDFDKIFDKIYPIGSIYITLDGSFDPNEHFSGIWMRFGYGRCLWGAKENLTDLGKTKAAGLPKPTLSVSASLVTTKTIRGDKSDGLYLGTGVASNSRGSGSITPDGIYGNSTTVQPPAIAVIFWRRLDPAKLYTVSFIDYNSDVISTVPNIEEGNFVKNADVPSAPTHQGLTFFDWDKQVKSTPIVQDTQFVAIYKYTVKVTTNNSAYGSIEVNGKSLTSTSKTFYTNDAMTVNITAKPNAQTASYRYTFVKWDDDNTDQSRAFPAGDVTRTATFDRITLRKLSFKSNKHGEFLDETTAQDMYVDNGTALTLENCPKMKGTYEDSTAVWPFIEDINEADGSITKYRFAGWYTNANATSTSAFLVNDTDSQTINSARTLYAKWEVVQS